MTGNSLSETVQERDPTSPGEQFQFRHLRETFALQLNKANAFLTPETHPKHDLLISRTREDGEMERGFKLKLHEKYPGAPLSPYFVNLRTAKNPKKGPLRIGEIHVGAECLQYLAFRHGLKFRSVAGVPRAGDPFAKVLSELTGAELVLLEKDESEAARKIGGIIGGIPTGGPCIIIDDLTTGAESKIETIEVLRAAGAEVSEVLVLIDREQGGREELARYGVALHSVWTIRELLQFYEDAKLISSELHARIRDYNPRA